MVRCDGTMRGSLRLRIDECIIESLRGGGGGWGATRDKFNDDNYFLVQCNKVMSQLTFNFA